RLGSLDSLHAEQKISTRIQAEVGTVKLRWCNSDNRDRMSTDPNLLPEHVGIAIKLLFPILVAQYKIRIRARGLAFAGQEQTSAIGLDAQHCEIVSRHVAHEELCGVSAGAQALDVELIIKHF